MVSRPFIRQGTPTATGESWMSNRLALVIDELGRQSPTRMFDWMEYIWTIWDYFQWELPLETEDQPDMFLLFSDGSKFSIVCHRFVETEPYTFDYKVMFFLHNKPGFFTHGYGYCNTGGEHGVWAHGEESFDNTVMSIADGHVRKTIKALYDHAGLSWEESE